MQPKKEYTKPQYREMGIFTHGPTMRSRAEMSYEDGDCAYVYFPDQRFGIGSAE
jgi:hypothetical protein